MLFKVPVVESCPYTHVGKGVMKFSHKVLATFAGAVYDRDEWIALLVGTRDESGLTITVTDVRVPSQHRSHASCELQHKESLPPDVVGVVHSHHTMGVFFSNIDVDTLNTRFPTSIVVGQPRHNQSDAEALLGFNYKAEGRVALPCGSMGVVKFTVLPDPYIEDWPEKVEVGFGTPDTSIPLHNCPNKTQELVKIVSASKTQCGIETTTKADSIFGRDGKAFITEVEHKTQRRKYDRFQSPHSQYPIVVDNRAAFREVDVIDNRKYFGGKKQSGFRTPNNQEEFLAHWGEYYGDY